MAQRKVLVAGALGVVGRAVVEHLAARSDAWEVVALSRRRPDFETPARFVAVDLRDAQATRAALSTLRAARLSGSCSAQSISS